MNLISMDIHVCMPLSLIHIVSSIPYIEQEPRNTYMHNK